MGRQRMITSIPNYADSIDEEGTLFQSLSSSYSDELWFDLKSSDGTEIRLSQMLADEEFEDDDDDDDDDEIQTDIGEQSTTTTNEKFNKHLASMDKTNSEIQENTDT